MQHVFGGAAARGWVLLSFGLTLGVALACGETDDGVADKPATGGGIFGGTGGIIEAVPLAGKGGMASPVSAGSSGSSGQNDCSGTPPGMLALLDDFNDGDNVATIEPARDAYWFMIDDMSPGMLEPPKDFVGSPGGYRGTKSAHVTASGFSTWGAALVANISHKQAVRCPYNASGFAGLRFVARGSGWILVQLGVPGVIDKEYGGSCDPAAGQVCYDQHSAYIELGPDYQVFELPWSSFQQRGFGTVVPFDAKTILSLYFTMETKNLPSDMWLDDVAWWDGKPSDIGGGGAGGEAAGGQGNVGAMAGGAGGDR